jgi:hypothetical protein
MVLAPEFPAVRIDGVWRRGTFSADELKDEFEPVTDPKEVLKFFQEAAAALSSCDNRARAARQAPS